MDAIHKAAASMPPPAAQATYRKFDLNDLRIKGVWSRVGEWVVDHPWLLSLPQRLWPIVVLPFSDWVFVARFDDVQEILQHDQIFHVPYGDKVKRLNGGPNFLLGMQDSGDYQRYRKLVMKAFRREDVAAIVAPEAAQLSHGIVERCNGKLDAIAGLITLVPTSICKKYYGLEIPDAIDFAYWTIAMSQYVFGDASEDPQHRRAAEAGSARVRELIDNSIEKTKRMPKLPDTVLGRLIGLQTEEELEDDIIRAFLIGMVTGFVPTNTLAAGNILDVLLDRRDFMARARTAALAGDDDLLKRCLFEALRFKHIHLGVTRYCTKDYTLAAGTRRATTVRAGKRVLASTLSAMFDARRVRNAGNFDPARAASDYMQFGFGLHWCIGSHIAETQITQTFKSLLVRESLERARGRDGQLQRLGLFPAHLFVQFKTQ